MALSPASASLLFNRAPDVTALIFFWSINVEPENVATLTEYLPGQLSSEWGVSRFISITSLLSVAFWKYSLGNSGFVQRNAPARGPRLKCVSRALRNFSII